MNNKKLAEKCLLKVPSHSESVYCSCGNEEGIESRIETAYETQLEHAIPIIRKAVAEEIKRELEKLCPIIIVGADIADCAGHEMKQEFTYYPIIKLTEWNTFWERY